MFVHFTVNPGQSAMWDSGFLTEVYTWRALCGRKISPSVLYCYSIEDLCEFFLASAMNSADTRIFKHHQRLRSRLGFCEN